jgi:hypothetical protein
MASFTQDKFELPRNLRGRSIHLNIIPTVSNLKNMIHKLILVDGDVSHLNHGKIEVMQLIRLVKSTEK